MSKKTLLITIFFLIATFVMTYPLILKIDTHIPGFFSTDEPFSGLWYYWLIKYSVKNNLSLTHSLMVSYPYGYSLYDPSFVPTPFVIFTHLAVKVIPSVIFWNLQVIFNLFFSALLTYLLIFYLTKNRLASIFGAISFAFCPYQFMRIWQHLGLTFNELIPLCLFMAILLKENPSRKRMIWFLVSIILLFSFDTIAYFTMVALFTFFLYQLAYSWRIKLFKQRQLLKKDLEYLKKVFIVGLIAFILSLPQLFPLIKSRLNNTPQAEASAYNMSKRPFEDLFTQSARPLSYFLPALVHPVFGRFTEEFVGSSLYGTSFTEHTLYLGYIPLILAFFTLKRWRKNRKIQGQSPKSGDSFYHRDDFYIGYFMLLIAIAWLFSQPPWWNIMGFKIYMPSFLMYKIIPVYRAYCRFGIVVMFAVAVLAGFGLKFILDRFQNRKSQAALAILACGLLMFEFWNYPPYKVIDVSKFPEVYHWIKKQAGDFVIAEYPLDLNGPNEKYRFFQRKHEKKIINGTIPGTYANKVAKIITELSEPQTTKILNWMGVKYVLLHRDDYIRTELASEKEELNKISHSPFLKFLKSFGDTDVYELNTIEKIDPATLLEGRIK